MNPSIWVVGQQQVGKHHIAQSVAGVSGDKAGSYAWKIDTKYYTAEVNLHAFRFSQQPLDGQPPEAVVIIIDASDQHSFDAARTWTSREEWSSAEIKLLVANKIDKLCGQGGVPARPKWLEGVTEWCTDNCCEYIEAAPKFPRIDAELMFDGEKQGIARIVAALQAHMWPGMARKSEPVSDEGPASASSNEQPLAEDREALGTYEAMPSASTVLDQLHGAPDGAPDEEEDRVEAFEQIFQELQGA
jgi:alpha- and gamma-adaptin-binding protein p34